MLPRYRRQRRGRPQAERRDGRLGVQLCFRARLRDCLPRRHVLVHPALRELTANTNYLSLGESLAVGSAGAVMRRGPSDRHHRPGYRQGYHKERSVIYPMPTA
jgi:hypothetical protein